MSSNPAIARAVEKQMRNWELTRSQRLPEPKRKKKRQVEDFICISRMTGLGVEKVTGELGKRLGWPVFAKEILDAMAGDDFLRRQIYSTMDERDMGWTEEVLRSLIRSELTRNDYFHRLCETLLSLARQGQGIFVGRGADLILPPGQGFRVRLVASLETRIESFAKEHEVSRKKAAARLEEIEKERSEFFKHHFELAKNDPARYDLSVNLDSYSIPRAVDVILQGREIHHR